MVTADFNLFISLLKLKSYVEGFWGEVLFFFFLMNPNVFSLKKTEWAVGFYHIINGYQ